MGTVTQTIGTASRNFSTLALWEAALPASLVTDGNSYVGQCFNDTEFNLGTTQLVIGGSTTDSTHTITLTTGAGQGFKDNAGAATNALRYNASNGAAITGAKHYGDIVSVTDNFVTLQNLQFRNSDSNCLGAVTTSGTDFVADSCIFQSFVASDGACLDLGGARSTAKNCLVIVDSASGLAGLRFNDVGSGINCTVVKPSNRAASGTGIKTRYAAVTVQNCAVAGFTTAIATVSGTFSGSGNAIDGSSYPTGLSGQTSLTIATEFVQPSNASSVMDWRLNSTSVKCKDNGTSSGAPSTDIIGTSRPQGSAYDVGAWELISAAAATVVEGWRTIVSQAAKVTTAAATAGLIFCPQPPQVQATSAPQGWQSASNYQPTAAKPVPTQATAFAVPAQTASVSQFGWYQPLSKAVAVAQASVGHSFVPFNTAQIVAAAPKGWYAPLSIAVPVAKVRHGISFVPFNTAQVANVAPPNGWFGPIQTAPKTAVAQPTQATSFAVPPSVPSTPTPGQFGWYAPLSKAAPVAAAKPGQFFVPFDTVQAPTPSTAVGVPLVLDSSAPGSTIVYYQARFTVLPPLVAPQNTVAQLAWQQPLSVAPKLAQAAPAGSTFVPLNTAQVAPLRTMAWVQPLSRAAPVAVAQQGHFFVPFNTVQLTNHITSYGWYAQLSKPAPVAQAKPGSTSVPFDTVQVVPPPPPVVVVPSGGSSVKLPGRRFGASYPDKAPKKKVKPAAVEIAKPVVAPAPPAQVVRTVEPIEAKRLRLEIERLAREQEDEAALMAFIEQHMHEEAQIRQAIAAVVADIIAEIESEEG